MSLTQNIFAINIKQATLVNTDYRKVMYTTNFMQLVLMSLKPQQEIGNEIHPETDQFIRIESGMARIIINNRDTILLKKNGAIIISAGNWHNIINASPTEPLKLYTIYTPPEHAPGLVQHEKVVDIEHRKATPFFRGQQQSIVQNINNNTDNNAVYILHDIEQTTIDNEQPEKVLFTSHNLMQLLLMALPSQYSTVGDFNVDQFLRIEQGCGELFVDNKLRYSLNEDDAVIISENIPYQLTNTLHSHGLKSYVISSPPLVK